MNIGDNVTAAANTTITIKCPVSGVPTPSVTWMKDGVPLAGGERVYFKADNSLVIKGVITSAKYSCSVQSVAGTSSLMSLVKVLGEYCTVLLCYSIFFSNAESLLIYSVHLLPQVRLSLSFKPLPNQRR